jgi:SAM-dependent methyltransferase
MCWEGCMKKVLLLGCGSTRDKRIQLSGDEGPQWEGYELTTLDYNDDHKPDVVWDLENVEPLPFADNSFDRVEAYEVLEHIAQAGDWVAFFRQFSDYWRVLKPNGVFAASVPKWDSQWAWGDPSHRRVITNGSLVFLDQTEYQKQVGKTAMSDFRFVYKADFERMFANNAGESMYFALRAHKPSRITL